MMLTELVQSLRDTGSYRTPPNLKPWLPDRLFGWSDTWYYLRQLQIIWSGNLAARRGRFGAEGWHFCAYRIFRLIESCGGKIDISGMEHVFRLQGPAVFAANHMSMMETMLLPGAILLPFLKLTTVIKADLLRYPLFGWIMSDLRPIAVRRSNPRDDLKEVLEKGTQALRENVSVVLFPQATRAPWFAPSEFNSLGVKLARRAGVPVVPVALRTDFQGVGKIFRDFGPLDRNKPIYFKIGAPLTVEGQGRETHEKVVDFIVKHLREWGTKVVVSLPGPESPASS